MRLLTAAVILLLALALAGGVAFRMVGRGGETVEVVHWTTGHLLRDGSGLRLLRQMAQEFNDSGRRTESGQRIEVKVYFQGGAEQALELTSRVTRGLPLDRDLPDPTLVTPSASHWLVNVNYAAGRQVIDLTDTLSKSLARAYVGIVTYRDMAECLGWPAKEIGYADIIALRNDPQGWAKYPCAKAEWGERPIVAYTDPSTSDTGRAVLLTLYAIAAGKALEDLTSEDLAGDEVVGYVKQFQRLVDHYLIGTTVLNTKVHQGPRYGHFFIMPEDNLIALYEGTERAFINGVKVKAPPIQRPMVMIYPKEGSLLRENCACLVKAPWVTPEKEEAAKKWMEFLRGEEQQRSLVAAGFRPGTDIPFGEPISGKFGLDPKEPPKVLFAEHVDPAVAAATDKSWEFVKRPGIVTFVVDTSGSMAGTKLSQAKDGLIRALDNMAKNNHVGFLTFSATIGVRIPVAPLAQNRYEIADAVQKMHATNETALYDAIKAGVELTDAAEGEPDAIRAVVVLTDGRANTGPTRLHNLVHMRSSLDETVITVFGGFIDETSGTTVDGRTTEKANIVGDSLAIETQHPIQIFFIGIGDADLDIGRILAGGTGAEFQGATEKDLAEVLEEFSKYF